jgi:hypothetical protein
MSVKYHTFKKLRQSFLVSLTKYPKATMILKTTLNMERESGISGHGNHKAGDPLRNICGGAERILLDAGFPGDNVIVKICEREIEDVFDQVKKRLKKSGFQSNQIKTKIITGVHSRAGAIVEEARLGNYGTIVVGRRGLSNVQEFSMGRVSNKIIQLAQKMWFG